MCGIIGYTGQREAAPILLDGLARLAYRGYDSAGIAVSDAGGHLLYCRAAGKLEKLIEKYQSGAAFHGSAGIGHTRWATHGAPCEHNAHPHFSYDGRVALVHNGIIENHRQLREELTRDGYVFRSETDTEVVVHLLHRCLAESGSEAEALRMTLKRLSGSYALAILFASRPGEVWAVRRESPLIVGAGDGETFLASDVPALLPHTREVYEPAPDEIVRLAPDGIEILGEHGSAAPPRLTHIAWDADAAEKNGYGSFMEKEIHEIPGVLRRLLAVREPILPPSIAESLTGLVFIGCGSAYHVGLSAASFGETLTGLPVRVVIASEFRYHPVPLSARELVVAVSQSGETADTLAALREAKRRGAYVLAIVNVVGSSIAREADAVFYIQAGPEIAVATTKAYCAQVAAVYRLFLAIAAARTGSGYAAEISAALDAVPDAIETLLGERDALRALAAPLKEKTDVFFIGRGADYPACLEGSLKLKEISYIHAEAYPAGELKHGTISLISRGVPVIALVTQPPLAEKTLSGVEEVRARGAEVLVFHDEELPIPQGISAFPLPHVHPLLAPLVSAVALELIALEAAELRGLDPDMPRNLAKSVTVE